MGADGILCLFCDVVLHVLSSSGPEVIKKSCSNQLSIEFQKLIKSKMLQNKGFSCSQMLRCCIYHAHKY